MQKGASSMAKFHYRMQSILDIKRKMETQAKMEFGQAQSKLLEEQERLEQLYQRKEAYLEEAGGLAEPASVDWTLIRAYLMQLDELEKKYQQVRIQMGRFDNKN